MTKKIGDKKIGQVKSTGRTTQVEGADEVSGIGGVKPTSSVGGVRGPGGVGKRRATHVMTIAERERVLKMIDEEADKLFDSGALPPSQREMVKSAVKMAVDSGFADDSDDDDDTEKRKR